MGDDIVLPADDNDFLMFKKLCESKENWQECYNKKNVIVMTQSQSDQNIKLLKVSIFFILANK